MENVTLLAIDLAKNVFQLHGVNNQNKPVLRKQVKRGQLAQLIANLPECDIAMEACSGAHYWARKFKQQGNHRVRLISPQHVKPFVQGNKTDRNDAEAIAIAAQQPRTPLVAIKNIEAQDIQMTHRIRSRYMKERTALANQIRGFLAEYGVIVATGINTLRKALPSIISDIDNELTDLNRRMFNELYEEILMLDMKIEKYSQQLEEVAKEIGDCKKLLKIGGVGSLIATAVYSDLCDPSVYKNGRQYAASLGMVPKERSSGEKKMLFGITKRGDVYIRQLLIHGARAVLKNIDKKSDKRSVWLKNLVARRGFNVAAVALANKNARHIWAVLAKNENYQQELGWA